MNSPELMSSLIFAIAWSVALPPAFLIVSPLLLLRFFFLETLPFWRCRPQIAAAPSPATRPDCAQSSRTRHARSCRSAARPASRSRTSRRSEPNASSADADGGLRGPRRPSRGRGTIVFSPDTLASDVLPHDRRPLELSPPCGHLTAADRRLPRWSMTSVSAGVAGAPAPGRRRDGRGKTAGSSSSSPRSSSSASAGCHHGSRSSQCGSASAVDEMADRAELRLSERARRGEARAESTSSSTAPGRDRADPRHIVDPARTCSRCRGRRRGRSGRAPYATTPHDERAAARGRGGSNNAIDRLVLGGSSIPVG